MYSRIFELDAMQYPLYHFSMTSVSAIKQEILRRLEPLDLKTVIMFGSRVSGVSSQDSDIDLYIVTKDDYIPATWKDKMFLKLRVSKALGELKATNDFDLIVHTAAMEKLFRERESQFSREVFEKGERLYG
jgi:uncharacterized protein